MSPVMTFGWLNKTKLFVQLLFECIAMFLIHLITPWFSVKTDSMKCRNIECFIFLEDETELNQQPYGYIQFPVPCPTHLLLTPSHCPCYVCTEKSKGAVNSHRWLPWHCNVERHACCDFIWNGHLNGQSILIFSSKYFHMNHEGESCWTFKMKYPYYSRHSCWNVCQLCVKENCFCCSDLTFASLALIQSTECFL